MDENKIANWLNSHKFTKATAKRAARTFAQAALSYIAVNACMIPFTDDSKIITTALKGLAISAFASGIAAVMNLENTNENKEDNENE